MRFTGAAKVGGNVRPESRDDWRSFDVVVRSEQDIAGRVFDIAREKKRKLVDKRKRLSQWQGTNEAERKPSGR
jgi:BMFP domain-containing protein YqiC